jgi:hypothetical protein
MSTRDPFIASILVIIDRAIVWLILNLLMFGGLWAAVWMRGLRLPWLVAVKQLRAILTGQAEPVVATLFALTAAVAVLTVSTLCAGLFLLWRRQGRLRGACLRGAQIQ